MGPTAVIFDVGGVLVESPFVAALRWRDELDLPTEILGVFFEEYAKVPAPGEPLPMWHQVEMGMLGVQGFLDAMRPRIAGMVDDDHPIHSVDAASFNVFRNAGAHWEMIHKVSELRSQGHLTAILTNNVREWGAWRDVVPLDWFDVVVDSCEVGMRKPDPAIWHLTLERLGVQAVNAVFLDDHPSNVEAAVELGMGGVVVGSDLVAAISDLDAVVMSRLVS